MEFGMKKLVLLLILLNTFVSYGHELSGVWYISRTMPLEEKLLRNETTSWGKVQTTAGAVVLDLENPEKYISYGSMYDYYRAQIQEVKKNGDLYTLIIDNNDPPIYYKIRFLEFDKIKFLENEYLSLEYYKVTSPRSADSESDNPPSFDMSNYSTTHRTLDNLHLRDAANISSRLVTTLPKDTEIQVIETGSSTTIDGVTAPWVKILTHAGDTGWCFSGYLAELPKPETPITAEVENTKQENVAAKQPPAGIPFVMILAIIGGAGILAAIVVVLIRRKRQR
jgi:hypothetical protein